MSLLTACVITLAVACVTAALGLLARTGPGHHKAPSRLIPSIPISRRATSAAGKPARPLTGRADEAAAPTPHAAADEAPVPGTPSRGAGASPGLPRPGDRHVVEDAARSGPGQQPWVRHEEPPGSPLPRAAARPTWTALTGASAWDGRHVTTLTMAAVPADGPAARARQTAPMPALVRPARRRHEAWQDAAANQPCGYRPAYLPKAAAR